MTTAEVRIGSVGDFEEDCVRVFDVDGVDVAVVLHEGCFYGFAGNCSHEGYSLDRTRLRPMDVVLCSIHFAFFDLFTGAVLNGPAGSPLAIYPVRVADGEVIAGNERIPQARLT